MCSLEFYFRLQFSFVFLSYYLFFFSIIVKCYFIAYKYSLQEYNVILLYIMVWIIWCLTYLYISKSWSVAFIIATLLLSHINGHIIYFFLISLNYFQS